MNEMKSSTLCGVTLKAEKTETGFPALFFYPDGERRLAKWTDIRI